MRDLPQAQKRNSSMMMCMSSNNSDTRPDFSHNIEELIAVGNKVMVRVIDRGTHLSEFNGIPATGKKIETCLQLGLKNHSYS
ncbi:MAG: ester cyclase [Candidatus Aminicenantales bacterium]